MIDLGDRQLLDDGTVNLTARGAMEALYAGADIGNSWTEPSEDTDLYESARRLLDSDLPALLIGTGQQLAGRDWYAHWPTPEPWASRDMLAWCIELCDGDDRRMERVCEEYLLFQERDMIPLLRHLGWLVQHWRATGVTWGVGRGSSVSSYILHLIGINRIDPLAFELDVREFLK